MFRLTETKGVSILCGECRRGMSARVRTHTSYVRIRKSGILRNGGGEIRTSGILLMGYGVE